jgi:hypothetical protein
MTSNDPHPYSQSSSSGASMMMMQDEVVYRERTIMYDPGDNLRRGQEQGGRPRALSTTTGGGGGSSIHLGGTQASATSPGTFYPTQSSLHGNPPSLPRHERKRRVRAIEEADRADADHAGSDVSPLMARAALSATSPPPFAGVSYRSPSGGAANPFAMLEALVAPQQQQQQQQRRRRPEQQESRENDYTERENDDRPRSDKEEEDDLPSSRGVSTDRAGRPDPVQRPRSHNTAPSSSTKRKAPPDDGYGEENTITGRPKDDDADDSSCDFPNHEVDPVDASEPGASTSRGASSARWNAAGDRPPRGGNKDNHGAAVQRPHDSRPEAYRPVRRNELSDHTNDGQFRGASVQSRRRVARPPPPPPPNPQPPTRSFLDDPRSTFILEHSRRQMSKAAQRASHKPSKDNAGGLSSPSIPKAKAVVRASSRSIVGSR